MEGTSFAIPINKVKGIMNDLAQGKHVTHGYVGTLTLDDSYNYRYWVTHSSFHNQNIHRGFLSHTSTRYCSTK